MFSVECLVRADSRIVIIYLLPEQAPHLSCRLLHCLCRPPYLRPLSHCNYEKWVFCLHSSCLNHRSPLHGLYNCVCVFLSFSLSVCVGVCVWKFLAIVKIFWMTKDQKWMEPQECSESEGLCQLASAAVGVPAAVSVLRGHPPCVAHAVRPANAAWNIMAPSETWSCIAFTEHSFLLF